MPIFPPAAQLQTAMPCSAGSILVIWQDIQLQLDRVMVRRATRQHAGMRAHQATRHATIEAQGNDIGRTVGGLPGPNIAEAGKLDWSNRIVVANDSRRSLKGIGDV